jgi:DNA-binding NarL/FixJ family response regulator
MSIRAVVVAHREAMVAEGLAAALARFPVLVPIAATTSVEGILIGDRADAVVIDAHLPGAERAAGNLRRKGIRVVFLGGRSEVPEDDGIRVPLTAPIAALAHALAPGSAARPSRGEPARLTEREQQVLSLVSRGLVGKQIARHLGISVKTVERHKTRIFAKLGVPNQAAAVRVAVSEGLDGRALWT